MFVIFFFFAGIRHLPSKMKLFLVAIAVMAAVHYGHCNTTTEPPPPSSVCELTEMFKDAMQKAAAVDMECNGLLTDGEFFNSPVSRAWLHFSKVQ